MGSSSGFGQAKKFISVGVLQKKNICKEQLTGHESKLLLKSCNSEALLIYIGKAHT